MVTEIRTFNTLKDISEYILDQSTSYRSIFDDYSQWLGSLLRSCEGDHKNDEWYQKSAALQKNLKAPAAKKGPEPKNAGKNGKGKTQESSVWVQAGNVMLSSTEQGQVEILFEVIEKINLKIQEFEKFKATIQQLERIGLGKTVTYNVLIEDDIPKKIVIKTKGSTNTDGGFRFATELSVPAIINEFNTE